MEYAHFTRQATLDPEDLAQFEILMEILPRSRILIENIEKAHGDYRFSQLGLTRRSRAPVEPAAGS